MSPLTPAQRAEAVALLIDDIVSCADAADGGKVDARSLCRKLVALLAATEPQWQDIATAPKDGTRVLLLMGGEFVSVGYWVTQPTHAKPRPYWSSERGWLFGVSWDRDRQPTHWQPLPTLPAPPEKGT